MALQSQPVRVCIRGGGGGAGGLDGSNAHAGDSPTQGAVWRLQTPSFLGLQIARARGLRAEQCCIPRRLARLPPSPTCLPSPAVLLPRRAQLRTLLRRA